MKWILPLHFMICIGSALSLNGCSNSATTTTKSENLPEFTFRGLKQGMPLAEVDKSKMHCNHGTDPDGYYNCFFDDEIVAGAAAKMAKATFDQNGFQALSVWYEGGTISYNRYDEVLPVLIEAYGDPCRTEKSKVQNAMGAEFENVVDYWCFKGGELSLTKYQNSITDTHLYYTSDSLVPFATKALIKKTPQDL